VQEDPFKLVVLAKDIRRVGVAYANFFFSEDGMSIATGDDEGVIRIYEYNPDGENPVLSGSEFYHLIYLLDPESKNGQHLLCRTEFHGQSESQSSVIIARRAKDDLVLPQAKLICGTHSAFPTIMCLQA
jgi:cleavage and polyadenylation specificity factor subunit 1